MPRYKAYCQFGEEPSRYITGQEFEDTFGIMTWMHPEKGKERYGICYSRVPEEWVSAILKLVHKIRNTYILQGINQDNDDKDIEVVIDQIKDKFGELRFYYRTKENCKTAQTKIEKWLNECIEELQQTDPFYGKCY